MSVPKVELFQGSNTLGFFTIAKSDRSVRFDRISKNNHNSEFKCNGYLIFPVLAKV